MLKAALFSDGTKEYRIPEEPECGEQVTIRFRTEAGDVDRVYAVVRDAVSREEGRRLELKKKESIGRFDFYETEILVFKSYEYWLLHLPPLCRILLYYFKVGWDGTV